MPPSEVKRIGVTGGRDFDSWHLVVHVLRQMPEGAVLVHGAAPGADSQCAEWWDMQGRVCEAHPAAWGTHGKAAGPLRNQEMVDSGLDLLLAFPGGRGTADMTRRAQAAGVPVLDVMRGPVSREPSQESGSACTGQ
jgi:hypothetical protein